MSTLISEAFLASVKREYGVQVVACLPLGTGAMSQTFRLTTPQHTLFLKIYRSVQDPAGKPHIERIAFSHTVQRSLETAGFPVPHLLTNLNDATYTTHDGAVYALSDFVEGRDYDPANADDLRAAGHLLGRLHQHLAAPNEPTPACGHPSQEGIQHCDQFPSRGGVREAGGGSSTEKCQPFEEEVAQILLERLDRIAAMDSVATVPIGAWRDEVVALTQRLGQPTPHTQVIHGDYRAQNLKYGEHGVCAVLDWDMARPASRLHDLAYALVFFPAVYQDTPPTTAQQRAFYEAYTAAYPLTAEERRLLPAYLQLAFLRGLTLWLNLACTTNLRQRLQPWIQAYLGERDRLVEVPVS